MTLIIYTDLPSANRQLRQHWATRRKLKHAILKELTVAVRAQTLKPVKREQVKKCVTITLYRRGRRFDHDNAFGAVKPLVDALRELGLIWNDSPTWLDLGVDQALDHRNPRVEIEITGIKEKP